MAETENDGVLIEKAGNEFEQSFGERLEHALNLETWTRGEDWMANLAQIDQELADAHAQQTRTHQLIRDKIFPHLGTKPYAAPSAGVYQADRATLERIYKGLLFCGQVEAADGTMVRHDTLPLTITQIGVSLVSYHGEQGAWAHRFFRRDLRKRVDDPVEELLELLERRAKRQAVDQEDDELSVLAGRGIMAYAERAILRDKSTAIWRMGQGNPAPYEILTGWWANKIEHFNMSLRLIQDYVDYKKFVFVPSTPRARHLLTLGDALYPMEFAIVETLQEYAEKLARGHYRVTEKAMRIFANDLAPQIVVGVYRVWHGAPPYLFYAHKDCAHMAAHIAMADSLLQEHRGFPMLNDLAHHICSSQFGMDNFITSVESAYAKLDDPFRYLGERETRFRG